jgi:hypothetical protein
MFELLLLIAWVRGVGVPYTKAEDYFPSIYMLMFLDMVGDISRGSLFSYCSFFILLVLQKCTS